MRPFLLVGLAACWAKPSPQPTTPITTAPVAATPVTATRSALAPKFVMPPRIAKALASEPLAGNVVVPGGVTLQATLVAARAETEKPGAGTARAMKIVRDHGDVVEVSTAPPQDCAEGFEEPYHLTVFVKRAKLYPRAKSEIVQTYRDGTAVAIDRGAPVEVTDTGLAWSVRDLAETAVTPNLEALSYAITSTTAARLPKPSGERLVCDKGAVMTLDGYRAARRAELDERDQREAARRREEQAELERKRREAAANKPKPKPKKGKPKSSAEALADLFAESDSNHGDGLGSMSARPRDLEMVDLDRHAPFCRVGEPDLVYDAPKVSAAKPTIDGKPVAWPATDRSNNHVVAAGTKYLGDLEYRCGRVRVLVDRGGLQNGGGGSGMLGGGGQIQLWVPAPGPVTWPDGTPAGTYNGHKRYKDVVEEADRICVRVRGVAERVCHTKKTTKRELGSPFRAD